MRVSHQLLLLGFLCWLYNVYVYQHMPAVSWPLPQPPQPQQQPPQASEARYAVVTHLNKRSPAALANTIVLLESVHVLRHEIATIVVCHPSIPPSAIRFLERLGHQVFLQTTTVPVRPTPTIIGNDNDNRNGTRPTTTTRTHTNNTFAMESTPPHHYHYSRVVFVRPGSVVMQPDRFLSDLLVSPKANNNRTILYVGDDDNSKNEEEEKENSKNTAIPNNLLLSFPATEVKDWDLILAQSTQNGGSGIRITDMSRESPDVESLCQSSTSSNNTGTTRNGAGIPNNNPVVCPWKTPFSAMGCSNNKLHHRWNNNESIVVHFGGDNDDDDNASSGSDLDSLDFYISAWTVPLLKKDTTHREQQQCRLAIAQRIRRLYFLALRRARLPPLAANDLLRYIKNLQGYWPTASSSSTVI